MLDLTNMSPADARRNIEQAESLNIHGGTIAQAAISLATLKVQIAIAYQLQRIADRLDEVHK